MNKRGRVPNYPESGDRDLPKHRLMSRLLGKIALEVLVSRIYHVDSWKDDVIDKEALEALREYVRYDKGENWPFHYRTLYPTNAIFTENDEHFEVLHEYDLLYTRGKEFYIVVILFGVEFAMNMGGRCLDGFYAWLEAHAYRSPLYPPVSE